MKSQWSVAIAGIAAAWGAMKKRHAALFLFAAVAAFVVLATPSWAATVTKSNDTDAEVDGDSAELGVSFTSADFPASSTVTNVVITLDFAHIDDTIDDEVEPSCGPPPVSGTGNPRNDELGYDLRSPAGTTVSLIGFDSYESDPFGGRVAVTLDDDAASPLSGVPSTGTFRPSGQLSTFDGEAAEGAWTLVAKDNGGGDPLCHYGFDLTLTVEAPPNSAPVASDDAYATQEDTPLTVAAPGVLGNDSDPDGDALTAVLVEGPDHGTLTLDEAGSFTYTPDADYNGPDSFTYKANDGSLDSNTATVSLTVRPVNDAPTVKVARGGSCGANDRSGTLNLTVADVDSPVAGLTLAVASSNPVLVPHANLSFAGARARRSVTATVASGRTGTASLTITVFDGSATSMLTLTLRAAGSGNDGLDGTAGSDMLFGQSGNDSLRGLEGIDLLCGGSGNDALDGGSGDDTMSGGSGNDTLIGGTGDDTMSGDSGNDRLAGGPGDDSFSGGSGTDTATDLNPADGDSQDGSIP
jgi:VCBS repeat-containing protein